VCETFRNFKDDQARSLHQIVVACAGGIERDEMFTTFNMGVGMVLVLDSSNVDHAKELLPSSVVIGKVVEGSGVQIT
jgi:phosphoribosylaminoimidazole (AIR) synthetase